MALELHCLPDKSTLKVALLKLRLPALEKLKKLVDLEKFIHDTIDTFVRGEFNNKGYDGIPPDDLSQLVFATQLFLRQIVNLGLSQEQVQADAAALRISESTASLIWTAVSARKAEIRKALQNQHSSMNQNYLQDFDWKVSLTMASDKLSKLRQPVALLDFTIYQNEKEETKHITFELTKSELDDFINTLESINQELIKLKA